MTFTIEERVSTKKGKAYTGLFCDGVLVSFLRKESLESILFSHSYKADEIGIESFELKIYPKKEN